MTELLSIKQLQVTVETRSGPRVLVRNVALELAPGESLGIVGESGSGKSMTARTVLRLLPRNFAVTGEVRFEGQSVWRMSKADLRNYRSRDVAMIFQDPRAHTNPVRKIGDFMVESMRAARGLSQSSAEAEAVAMLSEVGISHASQRMRQYPHELSGGMLQRVMIAAAFCSKPKLLVADEPTTALDVTTQSDIMATIGGLRSDQSMALLFITHDLELAAATCDNIAVMYAGTIVESGPAELLSTRPNHPYTAGLLRSRPPIDRRVERLVAIPGRPVSAHEVADGCVFRSRCSFAIERCAQERPMTRQVKGTAVACHRAEDVALSLVTSGSVADDA